MTFVRSVGLVLLIGLLLAMMGITGYTQPPPSTDPETPQDRATTVQERRARRVTTAQRLAAAEEYRRQQARRKGNASTMAMPMAVPGGTPNYFGPESNWAYTPLLRKFVNGLPGLNFANRNDLGQYIPVAIPDRDTYPGQDYYEIELGEYTEQMHADLQPTTLRGYRQTNTTDTTVSAFHYLGPLIIAEKDRPVRIKFTNKLPIGDAGKLFIPVDTTVMGAGMGPLMHDVTLGNPMNYTENRAAVHLHGGNTPWISDGTPHQWITPAGELTDYPIGASVVNVPDMPNPGNGSQTIYYTNQQGARLMFYHDHAYGITRLNVYAGEAAGYLLEDNVEKKLVTDGIVPGRGTPLIIQDKTFINPDTLPASDPTWPFPINPNLSNLWMPHVYMPNQNPNLLSGINFLGRWDYGPWIYPPWPVAHPPAQGPPYQPNVPKISMGMESFFDTPLVNGTAYPYMNVEPKAYRFRVLNASNDRFWNLQLYEADTAAPTEVRMVPFDDRTTWPDGYPTPDLRPGGIPDPATRGPQIIQIGTEGGFLPTPVVMDNVPIGFDMDPLSGTFGNVLEHTLFLGPAERADIIIDFSQYAGKTLILYNDAPTPVPTADARYDYYTNNPDLTAIGGAAPTQPGFGPNTRTILQIRVAEATGPVTAYNLAALNDAFTAKPGVPSVFEASQDPIIVPQSAYNSAYGRTFTDHFARVFDTALQFTSFAGNNVTIPFKAKTIVELFENNYGRMSGFLGVEIPFTPNGPEPIIQYTYIDPVTEVIDDSVTVSPVTAGDGTQLWLISHNGVDTHPVHFHLFNVQVINRMDLKGVVKPPEPNELGWKETVRMNPLENILVAMRPVSPKLPFGVPDSVRLLDPTMPEGHTMGFRNIDPTTGLPTSPAITNIFHNFGWEYMWHCHILSHEEMDMMRPIQFNVSSLPADAPALMATGTPGSPIVLEWTDGTAVDDPLTLGNAANEIGFRIERAPLDAAGQPGTYTEIGKALANATTFTDNGTVAGTGYHYVVIAFNAAGETPSNIATVLPPPPPTPNDPTGLVATLLNGPTRVSLDWMDNATNETGFVIERSDNNGPFVQIAAPGPFTGTGMVNAIDDTVLPGHTYAYRVLAVNDTVASGYSNTATITVPAPPPAPNAPTNLRAALQTGPVVRLTWRDNATNETGFIVERSVNNGPFVQIGAPGPRTGTGSVTFNDATVTAGNSYAYRVKAMNGATPSTFSNTATIALAAAPAAPTNVTVSATASWLWATITLRWTDNATNETSYQIQRATNATFTAGLQTFSARVNAVVLQQSMQSRRTTYYYRIRALGANNTASAWVNATPFPITTP